MGNLFIVGFDPLLNVGLVELQLTAGAAAQDYSDIARKGLLKILLGVQTKAHFFFLDHLEPLALSLRKSTDLIKNVNAKLDTIEQRRDRHELTAGSHSTFCSLCHIISLTNCLFSGYT